MLAPICLFTYNRPSHTRRTVEALLANEGAEQTDLIIFSDHPKTSADDNLVEQVREYLKTISGFHNVTICERSINFGLAKSIISGVSETIQNYGKAIVVEDDILTSPYFLSFMNSALDVYEMDDRVISIHGYVYPTEVEFTTPFFLRGADCWGWATWKRGWQLFNPDGAQLHAQLNARKLFAEFDFNGAYPYGQMLKDQTLGRNNSWAVRWYASAFLADKLTLYPGRSLVHNIGNDGTGTHSKMDGRFATQINRSAIELGEVTVTHSEVAYCAFSRFLGKLKQSRWRRFLARMSGLAAMLRKVAKSL